MIHIIYHFFRNLISTLRVALVGLLFCAIGCGYGFQNSKSSPLFIKEKISKIYIAPISNGTFKVGVEGTVYNNLIKTISSHDRIQIVKTADEADAILSVIVAAATYGPRSSVPVPALNPTTTSGNPINLGDTLVSKNLVVATEYTANLICQFSLDRSHPKPNQVVKVWTASLNRSKPFPAANQLDVPGTTSSLINESEFDRALFDLSKSMMEDLHESMLAMF